MTNLSTLPGFGTGSGGGGGGGGGGGSSDTIKPTTLYAEDKTGTWEQGWDEHTTYCRVHQYTPRGQFAIHSHTFSDGTQPPAYYQNRLRIAPFLVDQTTGSITYGTKSNAFLNTGGYVHSTQSFGFGGSYGFNWGYSAWGSNNTHYYGGCVWRVVNNAVVGGDSTGNNTYATENTSNGNLPIYEHSGTAYFNIPNGSHTSMGSINTSGSASDWASSGEYHIGAYCYIYRCIGKTVGEAHAGLLVSNNGIVAMNATGSNGTTGTVFTEGAGQSQSGGIGFELNSGVQVFFTNKGTYIRGSKTGGISYKATVADYGGGPSGIPYITGSGSDLAIVGITTTSFTYESGGYAAKDTDTFYFYTAQEQELVKFKIRNPSGGTVTLERLGAVDLSEIATTSIGSYSGLVDVTGNDDQFIVASYRSNSYQPSHTIVVDNPIKDN